MSNENKPKYVYCVMKNAVVRKRNGEYLCTIPFGSPFKKLEENEEGWIYGETVRYDRNGYNAYVKYRGFVNSRGFSEQKVIDMSLLLYRNIAGRKIPVSMRIGGKICGWIEPMAIVKALAQVDGWMLTNSGWTKTEWLQKQKDIGDYESMRTLVYAVIMQTVKDYTKIIHKIQSKKRFATGEFIDCVAEVRQIRKWFRDGDYLKVFEDTMTGEERLEMLDKELGVTDEWMKNLLSRKRARLP